MKLIDPFGGQEDLHGKTIKVLHNLSFIERPDTLFFVAIRFEERYQFLMDDSNSNISLKSIDKVGNLTPNRLIEEMKRLFKRR